MITKLIKELPRALFISVSVFLVLLVIRFLSGVRVEFNSNLLINFGYTTLYGFMLYYANAILFIKLDEIFSKERFNRKRILIGFTGSFIISVGVIFLLRIFEDVIIEGSGGIKYVEAKKTPNQLFVEEKNTFQNNISIAVSRYLSSGKIDQSDLDKLSLPAFPVKAVLIKSIGDMPQGKREMAEGKLASTLAHLKLLSDFDDLHFSLLRATQNPVITETTKEILQQKIVLTDTARKNLSLEKETAEEYFSRTANSIITEAEIDKTKSFGKVIETNKIPEGPAQNKWNWGGVKIE